MADLRPITLRENNDETLRMTIVPCDPTEDLTAVTSLEVLLKTSRCTSDTDPSTLLLSSSVPAEVQITSQTAAQIIALAHIPGTALTPPYERFWRVDGLGSSGARRTAMFGPVTVVDL
jgi:hypothetical protein